MRAAARPRLKARLYRILHQHRLRTGTAIFLPYDHGLEHGPRDFFDNPEASGPAYIIRLALEGGFNGIALPSFSTYARVNIAHRP